MMHVRWLFWSAVCVPLRWGHGALGDQDDHKSGNCDFSALGGEDKKGRKERGLRCCMQMHFWIETGVIAKQMLSSNPEVVTVNHQMWRHVVCVSVRPHLCLSGNQFEFYLFIANSFVVPNFSQGHEKLMRSHKAESVALQMAICCRIVFLWWWSNCPDSLSSRFQHASAATCASRRDACVSHHVVKHAEDLWSMLCNKSAKHTIACCLILAVCSSGCFFKITCTLGWWFLLEVLDQHHQEEERWWFRNAFGSAHAAVLLIFFLNPH